MGLLGRLASLNKALVRRQRVSRMVPGTCRGNFFLVSVCVCVCVCVSLCVRVCVCSLVPRPFPAFQRKCIQY